jgi:hypothetical protein
MAEDKRQLLTIGAFFIVLVVAIVLYAANIIGWTLIVPLVLVFFGVWILVLAGMRSSTQQKYERGIFSTLSLGLLLVALGGAWYLFTYSPLYSLALILLLFGVIAIAAALKRK